MKKKLEIRQLDEFSRQLLEQASKHGRAVTRHAGSLLRIPQRLLWAFVTEGQETKDMMLTFLRLGKLIVIKNGSEGGPTEEEIKAALEQLKDMPRMLPFLVVTVGPAPGITEGYVLLVLTLQKWLGEKNPPVAFFLSAPFSKACRGKQACCLIAPSCKPARFRQRLEGQLVTFMQ